MIIVWLKDHYDEGKKYLSVFCCNAWVFIEKNQCQSVPMVRRFANTLRKVLETFSFLLRWIPLVVWFYCELLIKKNFPFFSNLVNYSGRNPFFNDVYFTVCFLANGFLVSWAVFFLHLFPYLLFEFQHAQLLI